MGVVGRGIYCCVKGHKGRPCSTNDIQHHSGSSGEFLDSGDMKPHSFQSRGGLCGGGEGHTIYTNNGRILRYGAGWFQKNIVTLVEMFNRVGLHYNVNEHKAIAFTLGFLWFEQ